MQEIEYHYHEDGKPPGQGEVFVFGSNLLGLHGLGAAHYAYKKLGYPWGKSKGYHLSSKGACYGIPTKDELLYTLDYQEIDMYVMEFKDYCEDHPTMRFFVTRVGCGYAKIPDEKMAELFKGSPDNCIFPVEWRRFLQP
jgi:hypothetical protein